MANSIKNWHRVVAVLAVMVMLTTSLQPTSVVAKASLVSRGPQSIDGTAGYAVRVGVSTAALRDIPVRAMAPQIDRDSLVGGDNPYKVLTTNMRLPWAKSTPYYNGNARQTDADVPQPESARPNTPPDKKIYDEPMPGLSSFWEGLNQGSNRTLFTFGFLPPDTNGDTSGNVSNSGYYIQTVNTTFAIWDYSQTNVYGAWPKTVYGPAPINTLFTGFGGACETTNDGDPIVLYDEQADRWLISQFALPNFPAGPFSQCIAISQTGNPTGSWYLYEFQVADKMNDYPHFGIWNDGYYMTVNQFTANDLDWGGAGIMVFERDQMLLGNPAQWFYFDPIDGCTLGTEDVCFLGGMLPADAEGTPAPVNTPGYVVQFDDDAWGYSADQLQVWSVDVDWTSATGTLTHTVDLPVNAFDSNMCNYARSCISQPGTTVGVDAISDRLMYRLQYRNFGSYQAMVTNHTVDVDGADHAGIRWYELRDTGSGWTAYQQGDYAPDSDNRWMGSIAMDQVGNIALGYTVSSSSTYPSIRYAGRLASDPLNTLPRTELSIANGGGSQTSTSSRWGDYSSMSVAPANGCDFVYTSEYLRGTTPAEWYTRMGSFAFDSCLVGDITDPETTIDSNPPDPSNIGDATFTFSGNDFGGSGVASFECSLDGAGFSTCTSPKTYTGLLNGLHTFEVRAIDAAGNMDDTPASYSWTINLTTPGAATLVSPTGNIGTNYNPTYTWNRVPGATWYYLWVNGPSGNVIKTWYADSAVCNIGTGTCAVTPATTLAAGNHTWWIQTWNSAGYGPWSSGMTFTTTLPGAATLVSPTGSIGTNTPTYTWNEVTGATWYYLWVNGPSGNVIKTWYQGSVVCSGGTCSVTPATTLAAGNHTWWIQTWNSAGYGPWSSAMNFTTP